MTTSATTTGDLRLGHILAATGLELSDVMILRHTFTEGGLESSSDLTAEKVLDYTRRQGLNNKLGTAPPRYWLVFMADGARRSRFLTAYENHGEVPAQQTGTLRYFDLRRSEVMSSLVGRLVVQWSPDAVNWAKSAAAASIFPVIEIADPELVPFPGFDRVLVTYAELQSIVEDSRYTSWRSALGAVQGIYLVADSSNGKLYVGKADGAERILGRWKAYARDGHGGNVAMRDLVGPDPTRARHFMFSILRVFGPGVPTAEVDDAESHYKRALLTRDFGLNRN